MCVTNSKVIVVVFVYPSEHPQFLRFLQNHHFPKRLLLVEFIPLASNRIRFPINRLRNLGISYCTTSHYIVLDMDVWLSTSSVDLIASIPPSLLRQRNVAILLPLFFFDRDRFTLLCSSIRSCALLFRSNSLLMRRMLDYFPNTKRELFACIASGVCLTSKPNIRTHVNPER